MDGQPSGQPGFTIDIHRILEMIPHRYPFLMIDRLLDVVPAESATGLKNVTANEPFFQGHFPGKPVMPGVLIIEAMAQTAAVVVVASLGNSAEGKLVYFMSIDSARFRKPVEPDEVQHTTAARSSVSAIWRAASSVFASWCWRFWTEFWTFWASKSPKECE